MRIGIVICSRLKSTRLPKKAHLLLENTTVISRLVYNLLDLDIPIVVSVPTFDFKEYLLDASMPRNKNVLIHNSSDIDDPLARTASVAKQFGFDAVIRITHDKIFIDTEALKEAIKIYILEKAEYLYTSNLIPGTNFEIISYRCLALAARLHKNVEYISYAVRAHSLRTINYNHAQDDHGLKDLSLLLDYEDDFKLYQIIYSKLGVNTKLKDVLNYLKDNRWLVEINKKPLITFYTCAYNSEKFLQDAVHSVQSQNIFNQSEYILIDDHSSDSTFELMSYIALKNNKNNISCFRNQKNLGLSSSSNIALSKARGKYIIRLDSDDYFTETEHIKEMYEYMNFNNIEILYPDNFFGTQSIIQKGRDAHHVGGAMFNKNALNFIKFTDELRGFEGYDLFLRAKDRLKMAYFEKPTFFYTQRTDSLSRESVYKRNKIKLEIENRIFKKGY
jgi:spore coat polysaccharide biosynthesis protein SpsF (cytidylyltransferase family)